MRRESERRREQSKQSVARLLITKFRDKYFSYPQRAVS